MAQYRGTIRGQRGTASRLGSKVSGLTATANGWDIGVRVVLSHVHGHDHVSVYRTAGSNGSQPDCLLAVFDDEGGAVRLTREAR
jgi:hypothetical protein